MQPKKKLYFLINSLEGGGAERVLSIISSKLNTEFEITIVLLDDKDIQYEIPKNVRIEIIGVRNFILASIKFGFFLMKHQCNSVVSFLNRSNYVNIISNVMHRHKTIISERNVPSLHFSRKTLYCLFNKILLRFLYQFSDRIISVSTGVNNDLVFNFGIHNQKIVTINNPCDLKKINELSYLPLPESNYICSVGRLNKQKRFDFLLRSYFKSGTSLDLLILGEGEERKNLEALIHELNLERRVRLIGHHPNPYNYIKNAAFFVLSSDYEGFPNVLLEAMALGKAIISTDCQFGPKEILSPGMDGMVDSVCLGQYGILTPVADENFMALAIKKLSTDVDLIKTYEVKSKKRAYDFRADKIARLYQDELLKHA